MLDEIWDSQDRVHQRDSGAVRYGPQSEDDFESGKTSEDYMMKLLQYMWT
ncbi:unnamed protein product, partial [Pylaiella littoralis]